VNEDKEHTMADPARPEPSRALPRWAVLTAAVVLPVLTSAVFASLRDEVTTATAALVLVLWVVAAASTGDRTAGVLAAFAGSLSFDYFLTMPYQQLAIADPDDLEVTVLLVVIGLVVTEVALWGRRQQAQAARRSGYLDGVLATARAVARGDVPQRALVDLVCSQIEDVLGADDCRYVPGPLLDSRVAVIDHEGVVTREGRVLDVDRAGLPTEDHVAVVVTRGARTPGHFLVSAAARLTYPTAEQRRVAVLLADQVASMLDPTDLVGRV
jgi:K+-sensing histidine kinase KdpD